MTPANPVGTWSSLWWAAIFGLVAACHGDETVGGHVGPKGSGRTVLRPGEVDLYRAFCDGNSVCEDFDDHGEAFFGDAMKVVDCVANQTVLLAGWWLVEDAASRPFEWEAEVRIGGVFPTRGHVATNTFCVDEHWQMHSPDVGVAFDPNGFAWARLEGEDVFIPLRGKATIDHEFHATAVVDPSDAASALHVRVTVEGPDASRAFSGDLGHGDSFQWGTRRATVVRVVAPEAGLLGPIGWVEIRLADIKPARSP
jgi:hypothetical protein